MHGRLGLRRRALLASVAALISVMPRGAASAQEMGDGILPEGDWSEEQMAYAEDLVERTKAALPAYADYSQLSSNGYANFGAVAPGGYEHWTNAAMVVDDHILDPEFPESLVFRPTPGGGRELVAAMFFLRPEHTMDTIPEDIAWLPGWHAHANICAGANGQFTGFANPDGTCNVGAPILIPMTHVWIVDNECGHAFGLIDEMGVGCDVGGMPGGHHGHGSTTTTTTAPPGTTTPPPATPVVEEPPFTG